jgi:hypothetical protein
MSEITQEVEIGGAQVSLTYAMREPDARRVTSENIAIATEEPAPLGAAIYKAASAGLVEPQFMIRAHIKFTANKIPYESRSLFLWLPGQKPKAHWLGRYSQPSEALCGSWQLETNSCTLERTDGDYWDRKQPTEGGRKHHNDLRSEVLIWIADCVNPRQAFKERVENLIARAAERANFLRETAAKWDAYEADLESIDHRQGLTCPEWRVQVVDGIQMTLEDAKGREAQRNEEDAPC